MRKRWENATIKKGRGLSPPAAKVRSGIVANLLNTERSTFFVLGPIRKFRGVFPEVRFAGIENTDGSKYIAIFSSPLTTIVAY